MQVLVARIGKPHGIRGEVTVELFTNAPEERFAPGKMLSLEGFDPAGNLREICPSGTLTVAGFRWNKKILLVRFEEIASRNDAEALRNTRLLFEAEEHGETDEFYAHELIDLPVYLFSQETAGQVPNGEGIGKVVGLQTMPSQDLLLITLHGGEQAMIPFVEELVPVLNLEEGFVLIDPPAGLLPFDSNL